MTIASRFKKETMKFVCYVRFASIALKNSLIGAPVADSFCWEREIRPMMGERRVMREALFYGFSLERHVPDNHLLRKIDRFVDLSETRRHREPTTTRQVALRSILS